MLIDWRLLNYLLLSLYLWLITDTSNDWQLVDGLSLKMVSNWFTPCVRLQGVISKMELWKS